MGWDAGEEELDQDGEREAGGEAGQAGHPPPHYPYIWYVNVSVVESINTMWFDWIVTVVFYESQCSITHYIIYLNDAAVRFTRKKCFQSVFRLLFSSGTRQMLYDSVPC